MRNKLTEEKELIRIAQENIKSFNPKELEALGFMPRNGLYFPAIYYPPIPAYPKSNADEMLNDFMFNNEEPLSVYIHIPFCPSRCAYCHWLVSINNSQEEVDSYLENLEKEMDLYKERLGVKVIFPKSVLIGGGTPSMLSPSQMERLLRFFISRFDLSKCSQISCEVEPKTILGNIGMEKLRVMKNYGIDRISLGVQTFNDELLRGMGRRHNFEDVVKAIKQIRLAGFKSLSIDLIYGYPGCTVEGWIETLEIASSLDIDAYQLYRLRIVPHGAKIGAIKEHFDRYPEAFPLLEDIYVMKELGILISSQNGFTEMSRRVFCRGAKHTSDYLKDHCDRLYDVLGMGISSWTNLKGRFFLNTGKGLERYYSYINEGKLPIARGKIRTKDDNQRWSLVLPLKHYGVSKVKYKEINGISVNEAFGEKIKRLEKYGLLEESDEMLRLTKKGSFFADEVAIQFYHPDYIPFPKASYVEGELNPYYR